jgi:hypothetical protein
MKCTQIRTLLADYLNNELSEGDRSLVENHCAQCERCGEELEFLTKYITGIAFFMHVNAPADFNTRLWQRIKKRKRKKSLIAALFYPLKIKIPIEVAGACALGLLVLLLFNPFRHDTSMPQSMGLTSYTSHTKNNEALNKQVPDDRLSSIEINRAGKMRKDGPALSQDFQAGASEGRTILRVSKGYPDESASRKKAAMARSEDMDLSIEDTVAPKSEIRILSPNEIQKLKHDKRIVLGGQNNTGQQTHERMSEKGKKSDRQGRSEAEVNLEHLVVSLGGKVARKIYNAKTKQCTDIVVEIPSKEYATFIENLRKAWSVQIREPKNPPPKGTRVKVLLHIGSWIIAPSAGPK